jgi:hypothetical protein
MSTLDVPIDTHQHGAIPIIQAISYAWQSHWKVHADKISHPNKGFWKFGMDDANFAVYNVSRTIA